MEVSQMRAILKKQYKGAYKWVNKVDRMSENQVIAVYYRMLSTGQLSRTN